MALKKMENKIVLVTGSLGFVGKYVANYYRTVENAYVIGVGNGSCSQAELQQWGINEWHSGEITVGALLLCSKKPEVIIHCAGGGLVGFSIQHPGADFKRTVDATSQILEFMRLHAPDAILVYPSSAAVYGAVSGKLINETANLNPLSPYGLHKKFAEELCQLYARNYNLKIGIVRLFSAYGVGLRKQLLWDACNKLSNGQLDFPGTGKESRDWIHVTDAVKLMAAITHVASAQCPIINGGCGQAIYVHEVLACLKKELNIPGNITFNGQSRTGDPVALVSSADRAHALGWKPDVPLEVGVAAYADWFKNSVL